ncbi:MAG TPA: EamA family transporter [Actinomycetes bacterium]|nr:EamA family transporter [Actinomycetes bacterium]
MTTLTRRPARAATPRRVRSTGLMVWVALGIVYLFWGSTYLGIRVMVEDMPPLSAAGSRFVVAGLVLTAVLVVVKGRRVMRIDRRQLAGTALLGLLLPACGNGLMTIGEQSVASGIAALLAAGVPVWVVLLRTASGDRPRGLTWLGVLLGLGGLVVLVARSGSGGASSTIGVLTILLATLGWSLGSWWQGRLTLPANPFVTTVYEMLWGGAFMLAGGWLTGERVDLGAYATSSWVAWSYLVVFGSLVGFSAYVWLLGQAPLSLVATYAYVNPVVAVVLGALILAEPVTGTVLLGGAIVVAGVAVVVSAERPGRAHRQTT